MCEPRYDWCLVVFHERRGSPFDLTPTDASTSGRALNGSAPGKRESHGLAGAGWVRSLLYQNGTRWNPVTTTKQAKRRRRISRRTDKLAGSQVKRASETLARSASTVETAGGTESRVTFSNETIAAQLVRIGELLEIQGGESFRVRAYLTAAKTLRETPESAVALLATGGRGELERLPRIGHSISALIEEYVQTGRIGLLDRLEGHICPEDVLSRVPGVGEILAARIHGELGIETLEGLEAAAHDGRLKKLPGFGPRRVAAIRGVLASMLRWRTSPDPTASTPATTDVRPPASALLAIDRKYRAAVARGDLATIAPRGFNPSRVAWLPILHTSRGMWQYTALYSNTAQAHRMGKTLDWVVIYYERDGDEGQCTVVTEFEGEFAGWRVVRGREEECGDLYSKVHGWLWTDHGF